MYSQSLKVLKSQSLKVSDFKTLRLRRPDGKNMVFEIIT